MGIQIQFVIFVLFWTGWVFILKNSRWELSDRINKYRHDKISLILEGFAFKYWRKFLLLRKRELLKRELCECLAYIKNIVILGRGQGMSTQLLLEELSDMTQYLSSTFLDMAHCLHISDDEKACQIFFEAFESDYAKDIAQFLVGWESIPTKELLGAVVAYRNSLLQERITKQKKTDELVSDLVYFPVVLNAMAVLLNFIYVAYFIEQREALMGIF